MLQYLDKLTIDFEFSKRNEIWRAPRAEVRARRNFFYHHIFHEILHLLDTLDVFIFLKLIAVDVFEMYAFSWKKKVFFEKFWNFRILKIFLKKVEFSKNYQISNSSKNFAFWAMNKPKKLQRDFLTNYTFIKKNLARAHLRARRTPNLISFWKLKNHQNLVQKAEYSTGARAEVLARQRFFTIVFFIKFCISQIPWMYSYLLNWLL